MVKAMAAPTRGDPVSPKAEPPAASTDAQSSRNTKGTASHSNAEASNLLAPPAPPNGNTTDYFSTQTGPRANGSLSLEPNPFEQSFGAPPETPGGTKLPSVAALTSPSSLLPGGAPTPFNWGGGSLRTGPLSPAMLSAPTGDYYSDTHLRGGFPTPNESSLRTGLTPGGSGSMFPAAPSPSSQTLFSQLENATPGILDFHRTAMSAAAAKREQQQASQSHLAQHLAQPTSQPAITSQPQELPSVTSAPTPKREVKAPTGPFDPHDNDAANGLFLLAQGRNSVQPQAPFAAPPPMATAAAKNMAAPVSVTSPVSVPLAMAPAPQTQGSLPQAMRPTVSNTSVANGVPASNGNGNPARGLPPAIAAENSANLTTGVSHPGSPASDKNEAPRSNQRNRGKRNSATDAAPAPAGRRKAQEPAPKASPPSKKARTSSTASPTDEPNDGSDMDEEGEDGQLRSRASEDEKRKNFLERNRVAALKCRQRKKQWLASLQSKVEIFTTENEALSAQIGQLREEIVHLKTLLLAHKDCPISHQQGIHNAFVQPPMETYNNTQMNPYGMAAPISNQQAISAQVGQRRFS